MADETPKKGADKLKVVPKVVPKMAAEDAELHREQFEEALSPDDEEGDAPISLFDVNDAPETSFDVEDDPFDVVDARPSYVPSEDDEKPREYTRAEILEVFGITEDDLYDAAGTEKDPSYLDNLTAEKMLADSQMALYFISLAEADTKHLIALAIKEGRVGSDGKVDMDEIKKAEVLRFDHHKLREVVGGPLYIELITAAVQTEIKDSNINLVEPDSTEDPEPEKIIVEPASTFLTNLYFKYYDIPLTDEEILELIFSSLDAYHVASWFALKGKKVFEEEEWCPRATMKAFSTLLGVDVYDL